MVLAEYEIIILAVFIVVWIISMIRNRRVMWVCKQAEKELSKAPLAASQLPPLSVILTTYNQEEALRRNLPLILEQEYPADYEVIVVDMNSTDDTKQYLEQTAKRFSNLHYTSVPSSSRNVSTLRVALTLGMRAALNDWTVLTNASCHPTSHYWLRQMGQTCAENESAGIVLGYTRLLRDKRHNARRARFFHFWQQIRNLHYTTHHGAYCAEATNLCYRKSLFLQNKGFTDGNRLQAGAIEMLVNQNSTCKNTAICLHPDSIVEQDTPPTEGWWAQERLFFMETRSHFRKRYPYRVQYFFSTLLTWMFTLAFLATVAAFTVPAITSITSQPTSIRSLLPAIILSLVVILWQIHSFQRTYYYSKASKSLGERNFAPFLPIYLHLIPLWDLTAWIRWKYAPRRTFYIKPL